VNRKSILTFFNGGVRSFLLTIQRSLGCWSKDQQLTKVALQKIILVLVGFLDPTNYSRQVRGPGGHNKWSATHMGCMHPAKGGMHSSQDRFKNLSLHLFWWRQEFPPDA